MELILLTPAQQSRFRVSPGTPYQPVDVPEPIAAELLAQGIARVAADFPCDPRTGEPVARQVARETAIAEPAPETAAAAASPTRGKGRRG